MARTSGYERVYQTLLAAAAGEATFDAALDFLVGAFGAAAGVAFELDRRTRRISTWVGHRTEDGEAEYQARLNRINPRLHYSLAHGVGHMAYEGRYIDRGGIERHEFYAWLNGLGLRYFIGTRVFDEGDLSQFASVEFSARQGHPEPDQIAAFGRLAMAFGQAWRLGRRSSPQAANPWTPDHLPWAIFALDAAGRVVVTNASARRLLDGGQVVSLHEGELQTVNRRSAARLRAALRHALGGATADVAIEPAAGRMPAIVQVVPTNPAGLASPSPVAAVVYIRDPDGNNGDLGPALARLYRFSPAECRLAAELADGASLSEAAQRLGIARNTARNHLQSMFAKTGTSRQGDLLVQITGLVAAPAGP